MSDCFRPLAARLLRRFIGFLPLDGGYAMGLRVGNKRFVTPVMNGICNEGPEIPLLQLYAKVLAGRQGIFFDVGANVGQTLLAVRAARPDMAYVGCEPNVACVAYMRALIQRNCIANATVLPVALMDRSGFLELQLFYNHEADSTASLVAGIRPEQCVARTLQVPAYTWEEIATVIKDDRVGFVKIDVEGAELEVLKAIEPLLQAERPWMLIEILPAYRADYGDRLARQAEIEPLLARQSYTLLRVKKDRAGGILTHLQRIETIGVHCKIDDCDYLVVPADAVGQVTDTGLRIEPAA